MFDVQHWPCRPCRIRTWRQLTILCGPLTLTPLESVGIRIISRTQNRRTATGFVYTLGSAKKRTASSICICANQRTTTITTDSQTSTRTTKDFPELPTSPNRRRYDRSLRGFQKSSIRKDQTREQPSRKTFHPRQITLFARSRVSDYTTTKGSTRCPLSRKLLAPPAS